MRFITKLLLGIFILCPVFVLASKPDLFAICKNPETSIEQIQSAIKQGADVNARNENGKTALFFVSAGTAPAIIEAGADVNARDKNGLTARLKKLKP